MEAVAYPNVGSLEGKTNMADKILSLVRPFTAIHFPMKVTLRTKTNSVQIHPHLEQLFNEQINAELFAGYTYLSMANYFGRQCVALPGCNAFYMEQVREEEGHAMKLIDFVSRRGGRVCLQQLPQPVPQEWESHLSAFKQSLKMELDITQKLLNLHYECHSCCDQFGCNLLESEFLDEQVESVDLITRYITEIERMGCDGLATHIFDQYLLKNHKK